MDSSNPTAPDSGEASTRPSYWELVAEKVRRDPSVLQIACDNIARWRLQGQTAINRLEEWSQLLAEARANESGLRQLIDVLLSSEERWTRLREFGPFAGVLSREERRLARELCGFRH